MSQRWIGMQFPADLTHETVTKAFSALAAEGRPPFLSPRRLVVFELVLCHRAVEWRLGAEEQTMRRIVPGIRYAVPGVVVRTLENRSEAAAPGAAGELKLVSPLRPLSTGLTETLTQRLLATAARLGPGERLVVQWVVGPWLPRSPVPPARQSAAPRTIWNLPDGAVQIWIANRSNRPGKTSRSSPWLCRPGGRVGCLW